jgi:hypothetical protein
VGRDSAITNNVSLALQCSNVHRSLSDSYLLTNGKSSFHGSSPAPVMRNLQCSPHGTNLLVPTFNFQRLTVPVYFSHGDSMPILTRHQSLCKYERPRNRPSISAQIRCSTASGASDPLDTRYIVAGNPHSDLL